MKPLPADIATAVINPKTYGEWGPLLDIFDDLRENNPVALVEHETGTEIDHERFFLVTRYEDVMQISKDNKTFLNNPKSAVFGVNSGDEFRIWWSRWSPWTARPIWIIARLRRIGSCRAT